MEAFETQFAPAARAPVERIVEEYQVIRQIKNVQEILDALPHIGAILNQERQVIYSNQTLLGFLGIQSVEPILGKRPGEVIHCIHSAKAPGGCGTTENCSVCGAVRAILACQKSQEFITDECRITTSSEGKNKFLDLRVTVKPIHIQSNIFYVITFTDISNEKRKKALERIFFHDVLNMAGSLNGFFSLLKETNDQNEFRELLELAKEVSNHLTDEVIAQRQLVAAENGDLEVDLKPADSMTLIADALQTIRMHSLAQDRSILIRKHSEEIRFRTDKTLVRRILVNLLKNALEAGSGKDAVEIGVEKKGAYVRFTVWNKSVIPQDIRLQIFQRSFSSKGLNRGLGTYSVKLLTEQYLKGKAELESGEESGTSFFINLPIAD